MQRINSEINYINLKLQAYFACIFQMLSYNAHIIYSILGVETISVITQFGMM